MLTRLPLSAAKNAAATAMLRMFPPVTAKRRAEKSRSKSGAREVSRGQMRRRCELCLNSRSQGAKPRLVYPRTDGLSRRKIATIAIAKAQ